MPQVLKLVARVRGEGTEQAIFFSDMEEFVRRGRELKFSPRASIFVELDPEEGMFTFWYQLPRNTPQIANGKKRVVRRRSKKELAVLDQIAKHKEQVAKGNAPGHVPPVGKSRSIKVRRKKS